MDPRLLNLYEQELRYFRESAGEFARAFPKIAGRLGIEGQEVADPYVERLIEATAFLAARVGLKVDAEYPRFTGHLLDIVYPHFLAPTPSMAVCSFAPELDDTKLATGPTLPRNSGLRARQAVGQNTHCEFRTAHALRLWPLEITKAQYFTYAPDLPLAQHPRARDIRGGLRIGLRSTAGLHMAQIALDSLVLYFGGADDVAWQLHACMHGQPLGVMVRAAQPAAPVRHLPGSAVGEMGFNDDEALLPVTATGFSGYRLVQEYFAFPERFRFARIDGLRSVLAGLNTNEIELIVLFSRGDAALEKLVTPDNVLLHCVPAINLFSKRLDRVSVSEGVSQFHLLADRTRPQDFEIHTVTDVVGHGGENAGAGSAVGAYEQRFLPFYRAFHGSRHSHPAYFTTTRDPRLLSARQRSDGHRSSHVGSEMFLQIVDPQQAPFATSLRQLAVTALVTNRDLALLLPAGRSHERGGDFDCVESFPVQRVRMVHGPSRPVSPVVEQGLGWRVVDHLALNYLSLSDSSPDEGAAALREMLMLYAVHADEARQGQVRGLVSVRTQPITRRLPLPGPIAFGRGLEVRLEVDGTAFHGHSAFLFGAVMSRFLARHVEVNHFVETVLAIASKGETMRWRPQCGTRPIL